MSDGHATIDRLKGRRRRLGRLDVGDVTLQVRLVLHGCRVRETKKRCKDKKKTSSRSPRLTSRSDEPWYRR